MAITPNPVPGLTAAGVSSKIKEATGAANAPGQSFTELVKQVGKHSIAEGMKAEQLSAQAIAGQADINKVVLAMTSAELSLQTAVAVRDKVVQSYQEIMRMPI